MSVHLKRFPQAKIFILSVFLMLPWLFFGLGVNVFQTALAPGDGIVQGVPTKIYSARLELWNQYNQAGTFPFKDIGWQSLYVPGILVMKVFPNPFGYNLLLLLHYSQAGIFTFLFLRRLGLARTAAFLGGLTFMFSGFLTSHKGHHTMMMAAAYLPVVLYLLESFLVTGKRIWLLLAAVGFGLSILADYTAVSMYIGMVSLPYLLFRVSLGAEFRERPVSRKIALILICAVVIYGGGMLLAAIEILPILESLKYVTRQQISFGFFASYSFAPRLLPLLLFPYIYGATSSSFYQTPYFGPWNLSELAGYMGILPLLFAVLAVVLFRTKSYQIYFWTAVFLLAFVLVLGDSTPLYKLLYQVPVYNLFRAPARNWLEAHFAIAILGSFFVHFMMDPALPKQRYSQAVYIVVSTLVAVVFFILVAGRRLIPPSAVLGPWLENTGFSSPAIYVPLAIISLSILLVFFLFRFRHSSMLWLLIAGIIFLDLFSFGYFHDNAYLDYKIFREQPNSVAQFLESVDPDKNDYRLLTLNKTDYENQLYPSINLLYGFATVNAYSPIWLRDYAALTGFGADGTLYKSRLLLSSAILSGLSTKYIITVDPADKVLLQTVAARGTPDPGPVIVAGLGDPGWSFSPTATLEDEAVRLATNPSGPTASIHYSFAPRANTIYKIKFQARMPEKPTDDILVIDLFSENYDSPEQDLYIGPAEMSSGFRKFTVYLYSGMQPPASAFLRFFTRSTFPYEIKGVQVVQSETYPYWGDKRSSDADVSIYPKKFESPEGITVYENMNFLPRARFVKNLISVPDVDTAIYALRYDDSLRPAEDALVEGLDFSVQLEDARVLQADYSSDRIVTLSVNSGEASFLVLADSWYPGWKAFVDGQETRIYKTNGVSRGILIEGRGNHIVEFKFMPRSFSLGLLITCSTLLVMALSLGIRSRSSLIEQRQSS